MAGERENDGQQRQHCPNDHGRQHQKRDGSRGGSDLIEERHRGAHRHGVYRGALLAAGHERVHSLLQVFEGSGDRASSGALTNILSGSLPEFVLKEPQGL